MLAMQRNRAGWAADVQAAFTALQLPPTTANLCATLAVIEQESGYREDPPVPGLGKIARGEIRIGHHNATFFKGCSDRRFTRGDPTGHGYGVSAHQSHSPANPRIPAMPCAP